MQEILEVSCRPVHDGIWTPAELMGALERAATDHADALNIGHDRMVADFGSLWMLVRSRLELTRLPAADCADRAHLAAQPDARDERARL